MENLARRNPSLLYSLKTGVDFLVRPTLISENMPTILHLPKISLRYVTAKPIPMHLLKSTSRQRLWTLATSQLGETQHHSIRCKSIQMALSLLLQSLSKIASLMQKKSLKRKSVNTRKEFSSLRKHLLIYKRPLITKKRHWCKFRMNQ